LDALTRERGWLRGVGLLPAETEFLTRRSPSPRQTEPSGEAASGLIHSGDSQIA
jgi:hypothetical protein